MDISENKKNTGKTSATKTACITLVLEFASTWLRQSDRLALEFEFVLWLVLYPAHLHFRHPLLQSGSLF